MCAYYSYDDLLEMHSIKHPILVISKSKYEFQSTCNDLRISRRTAAVNVSISRGDLTRILDRS
jgi:hypothetical protein